MNFDGLFSANWQQKLVLKAKVNGVSEGKFGRPSPAAAPYDGYEVAYIAEANGVMLKANERLSQKLRLISARLGEQDTKLSQVEASIGNRKTVDDVAAETAGQKESRSEDLTRARIQLLETEGHLNAFKYQNGVHHAPDHPKDLLHYLSLVLVLLAVESLLNGFFWAESSSGGLVGGIFTAIMLAAINIGLGLLTGLGIRFYKLKSTLARVTFVSSLVVGSYVALALNAWIGARRANVSVKEAPEVLDIGTNISLLGQNVDGLVLFGLGVLFFAVAAYKGYGVFGSVPGYKVVSDDHDKAHSKVTSQQDAVRSALRAPVDKEMSNLASLIRKLSEVGEKTNDTLGELKQLKSDFSILADNVSSALSLVIETYRQANAASRPTGIGVPKYFADPVREIFSPNSQLDQLIDAATKVRDKVDQLTEASLPSLQSDQTALSALNSRLLGDELTLFFERIAEDARQRYRDAIAVVREA